MTSKLTVNEILSEFECVFREITEQRNALLEGFCLNHSIVFFENGYGASIICFPDAFGEFSHFEVAIIKGELENYELVYDTKITDNVLSTRDPNDLRTIFKQIQELHEK